MFIRMRKGFYEVELQFSSSNVESDCHSKGESFPLDFNLKDVTYTIEVEISPGKYT